MNTKEDAINFHRLLKGKIEVHNRVSVDAFYEEKGTPIDIYSRCGRCCYRNKKDKESIYDYTSKWNNVTIICDGIRVLGLGNFVAEKLIDWNLYDHL